MTTPPTPQDVREIAAKAIKQLFRSSKTWPAPDQAVADAVLAAVEPVIRQQVAEEIADKITALCQVHPSHFPWTVLGADISGTRTARNVRDAVVAQAAAIARSHSTREEQDHGA